MPQVDSVPVNDQKIACETLAAEKNHINSGDGAGINGGDPPESFWISKDDEHDWLDRNAVLERKESAKGNDSSTNNPNHHKFALNLKSKASIIGLPQTLKATLASSKRRRTCTKPANMRLFPKRTRSTGKSTAPMAEPGSPNVSCMGRVKSKRCRRRSNSLKKIEKSMENFKIGGGEKKQTTSFYSKVMSIFRSKKSRKKPVIVEPAEPVAVEPRQRSCSVKLHGIAGSGEPEAAEPPGLGAMKRYSSGRQ